MTESFTEEKLDRLFFFMRGNADAVAFCLDLLFVSHLWDDLIDRDNPRTDEEVNQAFLKAVGGIPVNPFYQANQRLLSSLMHSTGLLWLDSVKMERGNLDDKLNCFIARNSILGTMHYCLVLTGGEKWTREQGAQFLREFGPGYKAFSDFLTEFPDETDKS